MVSYKNPFSTLIRKANKHWFNSPQWQDSTKKVKKGKQNLSGLSKC